MAPAKDGIRTLMRYIGWMLRMQSSTIRRTSLSFLCGPSTLTVLPWTST